MKAWRIVAIVAAVSLLGACSDAGISNPELRQTGSTQGGISVLSWNVYVGTDVDAVIAALADGYQDADMLVLAAQIQTLVTTDFPTRAGAIADEIAARRPHVVGLQEITNLDLFLPPLVDMQLEFLPVFQEALAERGLNYVVAGQVLNIDVSLAPVPGTHLAMQDFDVMLVDANRVQVRSAWGKTFDVNMVDWIGSIGGIALVRGYVYGDLTIGGKDYSVVTAHTESTGPAELLPSLRGAQAMEIIEALAGSERAVVMGDLNDEGDSPLNTAFAGAGFLDVWSTLHPDTDGFTCCHAMTLDEDVPAFDQRLDYLFVRGIEHPVQGLHGSIDILGEEPANRIWDAPFYPLWPSDHAGLFGKFFVPVAEDLR